MTEGPGVWRIQVDTGGTFTDGLAVTPDGARRRVKILSTSALRTRVVARSGPARIVLDEPWARVPELALGLRLRLLEHDHAARRVAAQDAPRGELTFDAPLDPCVAAGTVIELQSDEEAPLLAARLLTGTPSAQALPPCRMRLATTLGTNALLQRNGAPTALFVTAGLGDVPEIGTQQRPELFTLRVERPRPLYTAVVEVDERIDATGAVLRTPDLAALEPRARELVAGGVRVAAIALAHAYRNPAHERDLARRLRAWGFTHVSCSAELAPRIKLLPRARTAVVDAYLAPVLEGYLERVRAPLTGSNLQVMTSAGGLVAAERFRPKDSLLSGPAGGVVGAARIGRRSGSDAVIGFDMGGTSTDVARWAGELEYVYEHRVGDAELAAPALAIETVAAGGGSICWLDGRRLRVGPHSAGADPGPACYDAGGPLTLTDVNLLLGRLTEERFEIPIDVDAARARLDALLEALAALEGGRPAAETVLEGLRAIADERMADAIRRISVRRGFDPAEHALVAFGGAGAQHACALADRLGMPRVLVPEEAAVLSAFGLGHAVVERLAERQVLELLDDAAPTLVRRFAALEREATTALVDAGVPPEAIVLRLRRLHLRFAGQESSLELDWHPGLDAAAAFVRRHTELFGHRPEGRAVELESMRVVAATRSADEPPTGPAPAPFEASPTGSRRGWIGGSWIDAAVFDRDALEPGARLHGPALVVERHSATVVERGWTVTVDAYRTLRLDRTPGDDAVRGDDAARPEAVRLELFTQRFAALVREMGERLERTAVSTNVKERLDFSCALLDAAGELVVNAPHIPVHLGALGLCVRELRAAIAMEPGDVVVTNHPAYGGSHLPDVTVVTPVHVAGRRVGYVASRAHHAEIGGIRPGSMPPAATRLGEEGVVLAPMHLVRAGRPRWEALRARLLDGPHPTRAVEDNLADLRAAVAANHAGATALSALVERHGAPTIARYMDALKGLAGRRVAAALGRLGPGPFTAEERLDDGTPLAVRIDVAPDGTGATVDFGGSGTRHPGNLNATPAIVRSAVLYVLRLLIDRPLPLNEGLLGAVRIVIPPGSLLDPVFPEDPMQAPAVVGGNVETSQRLVDTLLKALGRCACSQGTMNNVIFGNARYGYYETIGGGCGAGPDFVGASGVHSHMTNTRITDVEVLEHRYPVRVERFGFRRGSGGAGHRAGGDGLVRHVRFLEAATLSVLTQHRTVAPYGVHGGGAGATGRQWVERADGSRVELGSIDGCEVGAGDLLVIETPGGGGWGRG